MKKKMKSFGQGFTLVEVMITVVIIGILAAIALPSYKQHIVRGYRSAAQAEMVDISSRQQQFFMADRTFADTAKLSSSGFALSKDVGDKYDFAVTVDNDATPPSFLITFTPKAGGTQVEDGALTLTSTGVKGPDGKW
ncbi:type IV pilin protein [Undibacterium sp.]|uniref:type IV pilin protein n=1 Tax=Undibacterium sp. TaxID=1914977 RepID=UPI00375210C1